MHTLEVKLEKPLRDAQLIGAPEFELRQKQATDSAIDSETVNQSELSQLVNSIQLAVEKLQSQAQHSKQQLATASVRIASIVMQRIVGSHEMLVADRLEQLILEALERPDTPISIQLNADDLPVVESMIEKSGSSDDKIELVANPSIAKGECRCEYDGYALTSDLSKQIESIEERLQEVIND